MSSVPKLYQAMNTLRAVHAAIVRNQPGRWRDDALDFVDWLRFGDAVRAYQRARSFPASAQIKLIRETLDLADLTAREASGFSRVSDCYYSGGTQ